MTYATICDVEGVAVADSDQNRVGKPVPPATELEEVLRLGWVARLRRIYSSEGQTLEVRKPLTLGGDRFGSIRIGVSTLLIRGELVDALRPAVEAGLVVLLIAIVASTAIAQLILRPIHVIRSGLTRLGRGEFDVKLDLPQRDEFGELGTFFNAASAQLSADRSQLADEKANLQSAVEHMEDEVAIFNPAGELVFVNPAMRGTFPAEPFGQPVDELFAPGHPYRDLVHATIGERQSRGPMSAVIPAASDDGADPASSRERLVMAHAIKDSDQALLGVMLVARDMTVLGRVQSVLNYSRKLVALGRLSAGVAHEVKNPLNAMTIHLELLKQKLMTAGLGGRRSALSALAGAGGESVDPGGGAAVSAAVVGDAGDLAPALEHVRVISSEIQRLDQVMQGFLKFTRSEDLKLQAISPGALIREVVRVVAPECAAARVVVTQDGFDHLPDISGDPAMLKQAFLNLALNACQAMPQGGTLRISAMPAASGRVEIRFEDTGAGIKPEHLGRIFDLYFTTREKGSGIGLSMVYRIVQLHDGEIEVQSTEGRGSTFRILLPRA
jgi:signal transduction histidine kinase/HAMP domain-containing protein